MDRAWTSAAEAAGRILAAELGRDATVDAPPETRVALADFQREAVPRLRTMIARRGGAVLADSVGLGKTYVALELAAGAATHGDVVIAAVPAALRTTWRRLLRKTLGSSGWTIVSHAQLSRGRFAVPRRPPGLVVVDEAHRFRNPRTRRYASLARLLAHGRALLLTATPINNDPGDLLALLRLFATDDAFRDVGVPSLQAAFEAGSRAEIRSLVRAVVVRRSRGDLDGRTSPGATADVGRFPRRAPPRIVRYPAPGHAAAVRVIAGLTLAAYDPAGHGPAAHGPMADPPGRRGSGAGALVRLGLLKRLDSGLPAFVRSVESQLAFFRDWLDAARAGRVLRPLDRRTFADAGDGDPLQLFLLGVVAERAPPGLDLVAACAAVEADARALADLLAGLRGLDAGAPGARDPKAAALVALLEEAGRRPGAAGKVLVFTEFRDTAHQLARLLGRRFRVGRVDGAGAWLGDRPAGRRAVLERFAPAAHGQPEPRDRERVDVLVATDVLAEGVNLQDARHVVSYDLPWNPVRLLQRIGRVDRLGSPHAVVQPYLFVPDQGLDDVLALTRRLRRKLDDIHSTLGDDLALPLLEALTGAGSTDSTDSTDSTGSAGSAGSAGSTGSRRPPSSRSVTAVLDRAEREAIGLGGLALVPRLRAAWDRARSDPGLFPDGCSDAVAFPVAARFPVAAGVRVPPTSPAATLEAVVTVRGTAVATLEIHRRDDGRTGAGPTPRPLGPRAVDALERATARAGVDSRGDASTARFARIEEAVSSWLRRRDARALAPPSLAPRSPQRQLAGRVRRHLADLGATAGPGAVARSDAILAALARPLSPLQDQRVDRLLRRIARRDRPADLLGAAEAALAGPERPPEAPPVRGREEDVVVETILLIDPVPGGAGTAQPPAPEPVDGGEAGD